MPFTNRDEYPISPPSTTTSTDSQYADAQSEPTPACWGAVCAGVPTGPSRHSHQLQLRLTDFTQKHKTSKLRAALERSSSRAITILYQVYPRVGSECF